MTNSAGYMVSLDLERARVLFVGGGTIATRKIMDLPAAVGSIKIVSPEISNQIASYLSETGWHHDLFRRDFEDSDLDRCDLVFACTGSASVNRQVSEVAHARGVLVNNVSNVEQSSFSNVARVIKGGLSVGVSSYPKVPGFSKAICRLIEETLPEEVDVLLVLVADLRAKALADGRSLEGLDWMKAFDARVFEWIRMGELKRAEESLAECLL